MDGYQLHELPDARETMKFKEEKKKMVEWMILLFHG